MTRPAATDSSTSVDWDQALDRLRRKSLRMRLLIGVFGYVANLSLHKRLRIGAVLAKLSPWLIGRRVAIVERNLELCFPERSAAERRAMQSAHLRALAQSFVDRSVFWFGSPETIREMITVTGHEQVPGLIAQHGSVLLLAPHFVGLDAAATRLTMQGPEGATLYSPQSNPDIDALVRLGRSRFNVVHLVSRRDGIRALLRYINDHLPVYYLPDMDFGRRGAVFAPFFGLGAATQTSTAQIAGKWKLPVLPVLCFWDAVTGHYHVEVRAPLADFPGDDSPEAATVRLNRHIEGWVREHPEQYYWVHRRFKTRPAGQAKLY